MNGSFELLATALAVVEGPMLTGPVLSPRPRLVERKARGAKPEGYLSPEAQKSLLMPSVPNERQAMSDQERNALAERLGNYVRRRS